MTIVKVTSVSLLLQIQLNKGSLQKEKNKNNKNWYKIKVYLYNRAIKGVFFQAPWKVNSQKVFFR